MDGTTTKWQEAGDRLRQLRDAKGLKAWEVADAVGKRPQSISQYETGAVRPTLETALALDRLLDAGDEVLGMYGYLPGRPDLVARVQVLELEHAALVERVTHLAELVATLAARADTSAKPKRR